MKRAKETKADVVRIIFDTTNEIVVMGSVVNDEKARKKYINLPSDYFHGPGHAEMWAGIQELFQRGLEYDPETMRTIVGDKFDVDKLDAIVKQTPTPPANLSHHISLLRWDKTRYEVAKGILPLLIDALRDNTTDAERVMSLAKQVGQAFTGASDLRYIRTAESVVRAHSHELTARREGRALYPFGFPGLDRYTEEHPEWKISKGDPRMVPGVAPGGTTALTGLSGAGKTTWTANFLIKQAKLKRKTLWAAWEQTSEMSLEKTAAISLGLGLSDVMAGRYTTEEQKEIESEMLRLGEYLTFFELPFGRVRGEKNERFNDKNLDVIHQYVAESGCDIFIADVFKYALNETRPEDESRAIKRMNAIGRDCRSHMMLVHHLNLKEVEGRQDKRPTRDVVMGSSGWINDLDTVLALHCPGLFGGAEDKMEVHILKQRFGRWGHAVEFDWDPAHGYIEGTSGRTIVVDAAESRSAADFLDQDQKPRGRGGYHKKNR